jgi:predicted dehydrogenase
MKNIRVGFVGLGGICRQRHVPGLQRIDGVELAAVTNRSRASSEAAAQDFGIPEVCDSWEELVARDDLDAVFIGTWPYMHREISVAALRAGKHVFCQARMAMNYPEAQEMYEAACVSGRVAALCPVPFGLSVDRTIARLRREGRLGRVYLVQVQGFSGVNLDPQAPVTWRKDHTLSGLNVMTLGMYIEVMHRWFGWTRAVSAQTQTYAPERLDGDGNRLEIRIPDQVLFHAEMAGDAMVQYAISGMVRYGRDAIDIHAEHMTLHYDVTSDLLSEVNAGGELQPVPILPEDVYDVQHWRVEQDFIDAIRHGKPCHPDFQDGLRYMQVIQAVYDSAALGQTIRPDKA